MKRRSFLFVVLATACCRLAVAQGRRPPNEDRDTFPDYNRVDMHSRSKAAPADSADGTNNPPSTAPAKSPSQDTPLNFSKEDDLTPKAPPPAVPISDNASEPPLPDEIKNNLIQGTTEQK